MDGLSIAVAIRYHEKIDKPAQPEGHSRRTPQRGTHEQAGQPGRHLAERVAENAARAAAGHLAAAAEMAEEDYRSDSELTGFDAFREEE